MPRHASPRLPVVFSHANSFPAGTYRLLFKYLKERGMDVSAVERFGHEPQYPVTNNWPHLVQQLVDFAQAQVQRIGGPVYLVGHSLGGFLSVMAAARHPELARGVVLIDSPLIGGWRANALGVAKRTQVVGSLSPGKVSSRRRESWASNEEALEHFRKKKAFARWHPQVLQDYIEHGLQVQQRGLDGSRRGQGLLHGEEMAAVQHHGAALGYALRHGHAHLAHFV